MTVPTFTTHTLLSAKIPQPSWIIHTTYVGIYTLNVQTREENVPDLPVIY